MKKLIFSLIGSALAVSGISQNWYSKIIDRADQQEKATSVVLSADSVYFRAYGTCSGIPDALCSVVGSQHFLPESSYHIYSFPNIQAGISIIDEAGNWILSSENKTTLSSISVTSVSKTNHAITGFVECTINSPDYESYTIKNSARWGNQYWIGAQALNNQIYINYSGWNNYQESALFFVLNEQLEPDTTLILPPSSGAYLKIEDVETSGDSILYISFTEKYLHTSGSQPYLEDRSVIYGYDKNYHRVFEWTGPDGSPLSPVKLATAPEGILYFNYSKNYLQYIAAIQPNGQLLWETPFDQAIGINEYYVGNMSVTENGDIIGTGTITSAVNQLGWSGLIFRLNSDGLFHWKKAFRVNQGFDSSIPEIWPYQSGLEDIVELANGDLFAAGYINRFVSLDASPTHNFDIWVLRTSSEGCLWAGCDSVQDIVSRPWYLPVVSEKNEWAIDYQIPTFPPEIRRYTFSADSMLIENRFYRQLLYNKSIAGGTWEASGSFFREENGKVFVWGGASGSPERLLYNMDFQTADTLEPNLAIGQGNRRIASVGMIKLLDGIPRKKLVLTSSTCNGFSTWVEGMGDMEQLFVSEIFCSLLDQDGATADIRCFSTDGNLLYLREDLSGCYTSTAGELSDSSVPEIFPNPANNTLHIGLDASTGYRSIRITDAAGRHVLDVEPASPEWNTLDVSRLSNGVYTGYLLLDNEQLIPFRFVIAR